MPDPIHQIDYAPPTGRPAWWNRRTAFFVVLVIAAIVSGLIVVPRILTRAELLKAQADLIQAGERGDPIYAREFNKAGIGIAAFDRLAFYIGQRSAGDEGNERLVVVGSDSRGRGLSWQVFALANWTSQPELLSSGVALPPSLFLQSDYNPVREFGPGSNDPSLSSRFTIPVRQYDGASSSRVAGHIVGHLLPDDTVTLDWQPLNPTTAPSTKQ